MDFKQPTPPKVRAVFQTTRKKKTLASHGFDVEHDNRSTDSAGSFLIEKEPIEKPLKLDKRHIKKRITKKSKIETSSDEDIEKDGSDCEMITSV
ncbi:hypothetical protein KUTeg_003405 [Tegillarca granosa]|uniref:Uncharacterized protein n=1 Tax=Tegillarca granosa TaxID=220873 RepID=A0ABQ9FM21_TEGGR|nr:hypothetical protein KUTeg_003405 [Tegillarca granosa]